MLQKIKNRQQGTTIIEAMTVLLIFSIIAVTFYSVWSMGLKYIIDSKNKLGATALLNEKMEIVRNMPYTSIGVVSGAPSGNIPETETKTVNASTFIIETHVSYVDDPLDGLSPADTIPNDYKLVRVKISWTGALGATNFVVGVTRFVPPGLEVADPNTGVLAISIIDSASNAVEGSTIRIRNSAVSPAKDMSRDTDNFGSTMLVGLPESIGEYRLTVEKTGYETIDTLSLTDSAFIADNYIDKHASVIANDLSTKTIVQDRVADLNILSKDTAGADVPDVPYHIKGGRILGTNAGQPVYKVEQDDSTGADGDINYSNQSPGAYFLSNLWNLSDQDLIDVDGADSYDPMTGAYRLTLVPGVNKTIELQFANRNVVSLVVSIYPVSGTNPPLQGATVQLMNSTGYDSSVVTGASGKAFFQGPLAPGDYNINVVADGYETKNDSVTIYAYDANLVNRTVTLDVN